MLACRDVLPWWVSLIVAFVILLSVSFVTLPTYSLVVHSTPFQRLQQAQHGAQHGAQQAEQAQHGDEGAAQEGGQGPQLQGGLGDDAVDSYMVEGLGPATRALVTKLTQERRQQVRHGHVRGRGPGGVGLGMRPGGASPRTVK